MLTNLRPTRLALCLVLSLLAGSPASTQTLTRARRKAVAPASTLALMIEPAQGYSAAYKLVTGAAKSIDMTMYELDDTVFTGNLVAACKRGVKVRVILDQNLEKANNLAAYTQMNAQANCSAAWANRAFQATHQKSMIVDGSTLAIFTFNLTPRYYTTSRDFGLIESDAADLAAVEATFNADYNSTTSFTYTPPPGDDLIWSPTSAQASLLSIINGAKKTLLVENEELGAANIVSALEAACKRKVTVQLTMTNLTAYQTNYAAVQAAGCGVHLYASTTTGLYIHAKVMLADYGLATQRVYMGSINFSIPSMTENRELGLTITDAGIVKQLNTTLSADYAGAPAYKKTSPSGSRERRRGQADVPRD